MNGKQKDDAEIKSETESEQNEPLTESYEPTINELDDNDPPAEDSESIESDPD